MSKEKLKITKEVIVKITNKIIHKNTRSGITFFEARISEKQMDWLNKVYLMETGKSIRQNYSVSICTNGMEYGIPNKPINKFGNYIVKIFPQTDENMKMLESMIVINQ